MHQNQYSIKNIFCAKQKTKISTSPANQNGIVTKKNHASNSSQHQDTNIHVALDEDNRCDYHGREPADSDAAYHARSIECRRVLILPAWLTREDNHTPDHTNAVVAPNHGKAPNTT